MSPRKKVEKQEISTSFSTDDSNNFNLRHSGEDIDTAVDIALDLEVESNISKLLFLTRRNNNAVLTNIMPITNQLVTDRIWQNVNWGEWTEIAEFGVSDEIANKQIMLIPGNSFFTKLWLSSDVERPNTQLRIEMTDRNDGSILATATTMVNLLNINTIITPAVFESRYKELRQIPLSQLRITLSALIIAQGLQVGIVNNIPHEISFINTLAAGGATEEQVETIKNLSERVDELEYQFRLRSYNNVE